MTSAQPEPQPIRAQQIITSARAMAARYVSHLVDGSMTPEQVVSGVMHDIYDLQMCLHTSHTAIIAYVMLSIAAHMPDEQEVALRRALLRDIVEES